MNQPLQPPPEPNQTPPPETPTPLEKLKDALQQESTQSPKRTLPELESYRDKPASR